MMIMTNEPHGSRAGQVVEICGRRWRTTKVYDSFRFEIERVDDDMPAWQIALLFCFCIGVIFSLVKFT